MAKGMLEESLNSPWRVNCKGLPILSKVCSLQCEFSLGSHRQKCPMKHWRAVTLTREIKIPNVPVLSCSLGQCRSEEGPNLWTRTTLPSGQSLSQVQSEVLTPNSGAQSEPLRVTWKTQLSLALFVMLISFYVYILCFSSFPSHREWEAKHRKISPILLTEALLWGVISFHPWSLKDKHS